MINKLVEKIKDDYLSGINFNDRNYGLVRIHREKQKTTDGQVEKIYPVYKNTATSCDAGRETQCIPDSAYNSLSYHESQSTSIVQGSNGFLTVTAQIRNVWWINGDKVDQDITFIDDLALNVIKNFPEKIANFDNMAMIYVQVTGTDTSPAIFGQYSYNEANKQYLMPPYYYFAVNYTVSFRVHRDCVNDITLNPSSC